MSTSDATTLLADARAIQFHDPKLRDVVKLADVRKVLAKPQVRRGKRALGALGVPTDRNLERARRLTLPCGSANADDVEAAARVFALMPDIVITADEMKSIRLMVSRIGVADCVPSLAELRPRGWEDASKTFADLPGVYFPGEKQAIVSTVDDGLGGRIVAPIGVGHGSESLLHHECMHGFDLETGRPSANDTAFLAAREADISNGCFPAYELQPGLPGLEEMFAESVARFAMLGSEYKGKCPAITRYVDGLYKMVPKPA
jgi:hypothetical protein